MKYLRVTMPDGSRWDVPADIIAGDRAKHYAERDKSTTFSEEFEFTMGDAYELKDWAANNMNWSDVQSVAKAAPPLQKPAVDFQEGWVNGDKEIVEY